MIKINYILYDNPFKQIFLYTKFHAFCMCDEKRFFLNIFFFGEFSTKSTPVIQAKPANIGVFVGLDKNEWNSIPKAWSRCSTWQTAFERFGDETRISLRVFFRVFLENR